MREASLEGSGHPLSFAALRSALNRRIRESPELVILCWRRIYAVPERKFLVHFVITCDIAALLQGIGTGDEQNLHDIIRHR